MKIPEKLKVGAIEYVVHEVDEICESTGFLAGRIDYQKQLIEIVKRTADDAKMQTFLHEMIHAIFHHTAVDRETCEPSERDVDSLASALMMVAKDNPGIFGQEIGFYEESIHADDHVVARYKYAIIDGVKYVAEQT